METFSIRGSPSSHHANPDMSPAAPQPLATQMGKTNARPGDGRGERTWTELSAFLEELPSDIRLAVTGAVSCIMRHAMPAAEVSSSMRPRMSSSVLLGTGICTTMHYVIHWSYKIGNLMKVEGKTRGKLTNLELPQQARGLGAR
jgi:hypothetical protein